LNSAGNNRLTLITGSQSALAQALILLATLWPVWIWYGQRVGDQSDEPLGIVALITLIYLLARQQAKKTDKQNAQSSEPDTKATTSSPEKLIPISLTAMVALYGSSLVLAPKLISATLALIAIGICLHRLLNCRLNSGHWSLLLLSLPLVASLNFYLGYPLRLVVAQCAVSLLSINGFPVSAEGTSLLWHNQLIEIDAPCSGIKMLWAALYLAAVQLSLRKSSLTQALLYLIFAATAAVLANVLRVTSLFYLEAGIITAPAALPQSIAAHFESAVHTGTGMTAFLLVALILYFAEQRINNNLIKDGIEEPALHAAPTSAVKNHSKVTAQKASNKYSNNKYFLLACAIAATIPFFTPQKSPVKQEEQWPTTYEGQKLRPLPLTGSELEFARNFPGSIAMFQTDKQTIIIRRVRQATRQLHPAADCYRASGFTTTNLHRETDRSGIAWNVLLAQKSMRHLQVRERIYDENGQNYTDVSQWYWAALWGQSKGPWVSVTTVSALKE